jgi:riboflavin kinase/FMN adenylyltransferase
VQTFADFDQLATALDSQRTALTIGVFDGLHRGHQVLIQEVVRTAQEANLTSLIISFPDHPLSVLAPPYSPKKLIYPDRKREVLQRLGVDYLAEVPFTQRFSTWEPDAFVEQVLMARCQMSALVCGYDFTFGRGGSGSIETLRGLESRLGFSVRVVDAVADKDVFVKSTHIRDLLFNGAVEEAANLLTRPYELRDTVVQGAQRGRTIGYPTANLQITPAYVMPANGVYVCAARVHDAAAGQPAYAAMVNIGHNPTFGAQQLSVEAHLLDFRGELVGRTLELHFIARIREERKFSGVDQLVEQLKRDEQTTRNTLPPERLQQIFAQG